MTGNKRQDQTRFGAFIMTFERPGVLLDTITRIREQTYPPAHILVVDNSESDTTEVAVKELMGPDLSYYRVGYNSGPAGAARHGLRILTEMGFQWIYWGDDDNPPHDDQVFGDLFEYLNQEPDTHHVGVVGGKGGYLNKITGRIHTFANRELEESEVLQVDSVPGGATMLVNAEIVRQGILPREMLFFGFEEFDFCLQSKKKGFRLEVITKVWLRENYKLGFRDKDYKWKDSFFGRPKFLWRTYYSTRNLLYIYKEYGHYSAFVVLLLKSFLKSLAGFSYGRVYGRNNFHLIYQAISHFFRGKYGPLGPGNG